MEKSVELLHDKSVTGNDDEVSEIEDFRGSPGNPKITPDEQTWQGGAHHSNRPGLNG